MKILKLPVDTKIRCECGCEFEFDTEDLQQQGYFMDNNKVYSRLVIDCPFCKNRHTVQEGILETKPESEPESKHHCADCVHSRLNVHYDHMTAEWSSNNRCHKSEKFGCSINIDDEACEYFEEKGDE